jgi:adenosine deaminase
VAAERIPVELCLTSNLKTESVPTLDEHHWVPFTAAGVRVALCTDDSGRRPPPLSGK